MNETEALIHARRLLVRHGLHDWQVRTDHARSRCGSCHFAQREITLSTHFIRLNETPEIEATILHEIAHALAGPNAGHGPHWQKIAAHIGAPVDATNATAAMPQPAWALRCDQCRQIVARRHRRTLALDRVRCRDCGVVDGTVQWIKAPGPSAS